MKLHEFATLKEANEHPVTGTRMMSPDMMVAFLASAEIFRAVVAEDSEPAAALRAALQFGSEFNFINGHPASVLSLLKKITCATPEFEATCVAYANPETFPYKNATQEEFALAKLRVNPTYQEINTYVDKLMSQPHLVKGRNDTNHMVELTVGEAVPASDILTIYAATKATDVSEYVKLSQAVGVLQIPADHVGPLKVSINKSLLETHNKYFVHSQYNRTITAHAYTVG